MSSKMAQDSLRCRMMAPKTLPIIPHTSYTSCLIQLPTPNPLHGPLLPPPPIRSSTFSRHPSIHTSYLIPHTPHASSYSSSYSSLHSSDKPRPHTRWRTRGGGRRRWTSPCCSRHFALQLVCCRRRCGQCRRTPTGCCAAATTSSRGPGTALSHPAPPTPPPLLLRLLLHRHRPSPSSSHPLSFILYHLALIPAPPPCPFSFLHGATPGLGFAAGAPRPLALRSCRPSALASLDILPDRLPPIRRPCRPPRNRHPHVC